MTELIWPPSLRVSSAEWGLIGNAGESRSPLNGVSQTIDRSGDRWRVTLTVENASNRASIAERRIAESFLASIRNKNNRVWITPPGDSLTGSFPAAELFTNADFSNGTTGWSAQQCTLSVTDRVMRLTAARTSTAAIGISQSPTVTQYRPLVARGFYGPRTRSGLTLGIYSNGAGNYATDRQGLQAVSWVPLSTSAGATYPIVYDGGWNVSITGDWIDTPFVSLANCALVDNGGNYMLQSDAAQTTWAATNVTVSANAHTAPDGTSTADGLIEDSSTGFHFLQQSYTRASVAEGWCAYADMASVASSRNGALDVSDGAGNGSTCIFDLTAGTAGTPNISGTATNARAFIVALGNGYYRCYLIARLPASTTTRMQVLISNGSTLSYAGNGSGRISVWRMGANRTAIPSRATATTTTVVAPANQTGGGLYLKGLPASTQNLAYAGDWCQIGDQLFKLTAALDSDAAGLGYLQISPNVRAPFADNAPVIFNQPMAKMRLADEEMSWTRAPGGFGTFKLSFEESL